MPDKNPAFKHSKVKLWIAEKNGRVVGRVAGIINDLETQSRGAVHGRFGWMEFEDDLEISRALLDKVSDWAKENGCARIKGPVGFSGFDPAGFTIEGFEEVGTLSGPFHYPYYRRHMEFHGFQKMSDYFEYKVETIPKEIPEKLQRLTPIIEKKFGIRLTSYQSQAELKRRIYEFFYLITTSYSELSSFVPFSNEELEKYARDILPLMKPEYAPLLRDGDGRMAGFALFIPSYGNALIRAKGRLYPFGFLHLLWNRRFHRELDLVLIGVLEKWRGKGLNAPIFSHCIPILNKQKIRMVRLNPQLEENQPAQAIFRDYNPRMFRKRRVYWKELPQ